MYWKWHLMIPPVSRGVMYSMCSAISCTFLSEMPWAQWPHKRLSQTCLWMSRSLWRKCGSTVACLGVRGTDWNNPDISPNEGGVITAITLLQFGLRPSYREGTQPHPSRENRVKDLLSMAPPIRARPRFPHNQFLSSRSFHEPHPHTSESRQNENYNYRKLNWSLGSWWCLT